MTEDELNNFKQAIMEVCVLHNIYISHEDHQGGFLVVNGDGISLKYKKILKEWFMDAEEDTR